VTVLNHAAKTISYCQQTLSTSRTANLSDCPSAHTSVQKTVYIASVIWNQQ